MGDLKDVGLSLFQGEESLHIDHNKKRLEEEEAEADQRKRKEELQDILTKAFEDMSYDDDDDCDDDDDDGDDEEEADEYNEDRSITYRSNQGDILPDYVSENNFRVLPPRPVTEGSVVFPENNHSSSPKTNGNNVVSGSSQEAGDYLPSHLAYPPGGGFGAPTRERLPSTPLGNVSNNQHTVAASSGPENVDQNEVYRQAAYNSTEQLQVLYEVRTREVQRLTQELAAVRAEAAAEVDSLYRRIALREAERDRAVLQLKNAQSLLVESKGKITTLQNKVETLQKNISNLESSKKQLETQLAAAQSSATELQHRVLTLERSRLGDGEALLRQAEERHRREVERLRQQAEDRTAQFKEQEKELSEREARLREQNRQQERLLVEKSEAVSALARQLEEVQREWGRRLAEGGELAELRASLAASDADRKRLGQQLAEAQCEAERLRSELRQYEALDSLGLLTSSHSESTSPLGTRPEPTGGVGLHAKIRQELQRSLANQKVKREEIQRLQQLVREKDSELSLLKKQQELYLEEANRFKDEAEKLYGQLSQQADADERVNAAEKTREEAEIRMKAKETEIVRLTAMLRDSEQKVKDLEDKMRSLQENAAAQCKEEFLRFHEQALARARQEYEAECVRISTQLEHALQECDQVKQMYVEMCGSKEELARSLEVERERSDTLQARLDTHVARVSFEIDRAKRQTMEAVAGETPVRPETRDVSVETEYVPPAVSKGNGCPSCESLRQSASFLEGRTKGLAEELSRRQQELRDGRIQVSKLQRELADAVARRDSLQQEQETLRRAMDEGSRLKLEVMRLETELSRRRQSEEKRKGDDLPRLTAEMERLTKELASAKEAGVSSQQEVKRLEGEVAALKEQILRLQADVEEARGLRDRLSDRERELDAARKEAAEASLRLTAELAAARGLCSQLADKLKESRVDRRDSGTSTETEFPNIEELQEKHRQEIERVKDQTVDFFAEQVLQLKEQHRASIAKVEQMYVEGLHAARLAAVEAREQVATLRREKEEAEKHLTHLQKTLNEVKAELTRVRSKYHTAKKVVQDYKVWAAKREEHCREEWKRVEDGYRKSMLQLQERMEQMLSLQQKT